MTKLNKIANIIILTSVSSLSVATHAADLQFTQSLQTKQETSNTTHVDKKGISTTTDSSVVANNNSNLAKPAVSENETTTSDQTTSPVATANSDINNANQMSVSQANNILTNGGNVILNAASSTSGLVSAASDLSQTFATNTDNQLNNAATATSGTFNNVALTLSEQPVASDATITQNLQYTLQSSVQQSTLNSLQTSLQQNVSGQVSSAINQQIANEVAASTASEVRARSRTLP